MKKSSQREWPIAFHEGGHVLGHRLKGVTIRTATIIPSLDRQDDSAVENFKGEKTMMRKRGTLQ